ncbi:MAG: DMT family transporter [Candidatus Saccharimonadales bacterium]
MKKKQIWFLIALVGALLGAPNAMFMRYAVGDWHPYLLNTIRFGVVAIICLPWIWRERKNMFGAARKPTLIASAAITVASLAFILGLQHSQASYVSILQLLAPVVLVWYSVKLTGERVSRRALAGITLAASGATMVALLPFALQQNSAFVFYPFATVCGIVNAFSYPMVSIAMSQANQKYKVSLVALAGVSSGVVAIVSVLLWVSIGHSALPHITPRGVLAILYSVVAVSLISRVLSVWAYERVGSATISALVYLEGLIAVILPIVFLHEKMSVAMVVGGVFILLGVFIVQFKESAHHKHRHITRNH